MSRFLRTTLVAFAVVLVIGGHSTVRASSEGTTALCSQDLEESGYLLRCDAALQNLVAYGRSYAWKFWRDPNDSTSRRYQIVGGAAVSRPYEAPGRFFYQLTVSNGTPSGTHVYGPYAVDIADAPSSEAPTGPDTPPSFDTATAGFQISATSVKVWEKITFTADQPATDDIWYQWNFSDGYTSYAPSLTRSFIKRGNFGVKLTVYQNQSGNWILADVSEWKTITVRAGYTQILRVVGGSIGENLGVGVSNGIAWSLGRGAFSTVDVADPNSDKFGTILSTSGQFASRATSLAVSDNLVAVGAGTLGVFFFDSTNPLDLTPIANEIFYYHAPHGAFRISVLSLHFHGDLLFVGLSHGLRVLNVANPHAPRLVGTMNGINVWTLYTHAGHVLVGTQRPMGFFLFPIPDGSVRSPVNMVADGFVTTRYRPQQFAHEGDVVVVAENTYTSGDVSFFNAAENYKPIGRVGGGGAWYRGATVINGVAFSAMGPNLTSILFNSDKVVWVGAGGELGGAHFGFHLASDNRGLVYAGTANATLIILEFKE